jgi:RNA polymerase sigma factor (sigma-70 family)
MIDKVLIEDLKQGNANALKAVYLGNKSAFIGFAKKYPLEETVVTDIYQDAIIALRENAINGKLDDLKSELKTYLFSIGKYMIYKNLKQQQKMHLVDDATKIDKLRSTPDFSIDLAEELTEEQEILRVAFQNLGQKCKEVLTLFYYRGFDLEEIMNELNYTNKDVVKSQKSRCIKSLKSMIFKN